MLTQFQDALRGKIWLQFQCESDTDIVKRTLGDSVSSGATLFHLEILGVYPKIFKCLEKWFPS